jgi:hypothetical protein
LTIVLAGIARKVLGREKHYLCPYRKNPIRCKGHLQELFDPDGRHRQHHSGHMPDFRDPKHKRLRPDTDRDPLDQIEAQCSYCLAGFWGKSLKTISEMKLLPQDIETWKNTREIKVMRKFCPKVFPPDQIKRAEEQARP